METIAYEVRGSVAINLADQVMFEKHFGLSKRYAKAAWKAVSAEEFKGFKPEELVGYKKIVKALPGVGVKTAEKLEKAGAFKTVFYIVMNVGKASYRIAGLHETVEEAQAAYALEASTKEAVRPIEIKVARGTGITAEKTTVGKINLDKRLKQIQLGHLKKDGPSWVVDAELVAATGEAFEPKPAMKEKSYKVADVSNLPLSPLSFHCLNRGVIGLADLSIAFGASAFSTANRAYTKEHPIIDDETKELKGFYFTHHAGWHKHHGFNDWSKAGSEDKPQSCELEVHIPEAVKWEIFSDLKKAMPNNPQPVEPLTGDELKLEWKNPPSRQFPDVGLLYSDYELMLTMIKMSSMAGRSIAFEESEGTSLDHGTVPYPTSFRAMRKDENPTQETHNRLHEKLSSMPIDEKTEFKLECEKAYYSPEYQLLLKAENLPGLVSNAKAKNPEIEATKKAMKKLPPGKEKDALRAKLKGLKNKPKVVNNLVDCSKFFKCLNSQEKDIVSGLLESLKVAKPGKENHLMPQDVKRLGKHISRAAGSDVAWRARHWLEEADKFGGCDKALTYWTLMEAAVNDESTGGAVYMSAAYKESQVLEEHVHKDEVQDQLDCSQDEDISENFKANDAVVHQQTFAFHQKKENAEILEVTLSEGVPARETQVRMPDGSLFTTMTEALPCSENREDLRALLSASWERQGEIPGDNGLDESDDDTFNPMAELFDSQETEEE